MKKFFFFILLPFWVNGKTHWQADLQKPFMFSIQIQHQEISLGDTLHLEVEYHHPSSYAINREDFIDQLIWSANPFDQQWALLDSDASPLPVEGEIQGERLTFTLSPLTTGKLELPFFNILFSPKEKGGDSLTVISPIFTFDVPLPPPLLSLGFAPLIPLEPQFPLEISLENREQIIGNAQEIEKIKKWIRHDLETRTFPWISLTFLLAIAGAGWFFYLMRDRLPKRIIQQNTALSPKQKIDQELNTLKSFSFNPQQPSLYYTKLSSVLHDAIEAKSGLKVQTCTTIELAKKMRKQSSIPKERVDRALSLLKEMDLVKFANKKPSQSDAEQCLQQTVQLINEFLKEEKQEVNDQNFFIAK